MLPTMYMGIELVAWLPLTPNQSGRYFLYVRAGINIWVSIQLTIPLNPYTGFTAIVFVVYAKAIAATSASPFQAPIQDLNVVV